MPARVQDGGGQRGARPLQCCQADFVHFNREVQRKYSLQVLEYLYRRTRDFGADAIARQDREFHGMDQSAIDTLDSGFSLSTEPACGRVRKCIWPRVGPE